MSMSVNDRFRFFFNGAATTEIYTLSLHDALPISEQPRVLRVARKDLVAGTEVEPGERAQDALARRGGQRDVGDRKSTRLNSSHVNISYAVFCSKKKVQVLVSL